MAFNRLKLNPSKSEVLRRVVKSFPLWGEQSSVWAVDRSPSCRLMS